MRTAYIFFDRAIFVGGDSSRATSRRTRIEVEEEEERVSTPLVHCTCCTACCTRAREDELVRVFVVERLERTKHSATRELKQRFETSIHVRLRDPSLLFLDFGRVRN